MKKMSMGRLIVLFSVIVLVVGCRTPSESSDSKKRGGGVVSPSGMVKIPAGSFNMGNHDSAYTGTRELPTHQVTLKSFYIAETEVTAAQYKSCVDAGSCTYTIDPNSANQTYNVSGKEDHPINFVTWNDVQTYITWINSEKSSHYRMCSEAEWEYAARAGSTTKYPCGDDAACLDSYAWYKNTSNDTTHPVKTKKPNAWGVYDMIGNVYEWVQDTGHKTYAGAPTDGSAWEAGGNGEWMYRGGFFKTSDRLSRVARRMDRKDTGFSMGIRLCAGSLADTPPVVSSTDPTDGKRNVAVNSAIAITFNEPIDPSTVTTNTADTSCSGSLQLSTDNFSTCVKMNAAPSASQGNKVFTVTPAAYLAYDTTHDIRVTTTVTDKGGNAMASPFTTSGGFRTAVQDVTPPTVSSTQPVDNTTSISPNTSVSVVFSETIDPSTVTTNTADTSCSGSLQLSTDDFSTCVKMRAAPVASNENRTFTITPATPLASDTTHDIRVTTAVTDAAIGPKNALAAVYTTPNGFRTSSDTVKPRVLSVKPADSSTDIPINSNISVTFDERMNPSTVTDNTADTTCSGSVQVSNDDFGTCVQMKAVPADSSGDEVFTVTPNANLAANTTFKVKITTAVQDAAGNDLSSDYVTTTGFTTGTETAPEVTDTTPDDNSSNIALNTTIGVTFSEAVDPATVTVNTTNTTCSGSFQLSSDNFTTCVRMSGTPTASNGNKSFSVTPNSELVYNKIYKIKITPSVKTTNGRALLGNEAYISSKGFESRAMVAIATGNFTMGSDASDDASADANELPEHIVTFASGFYMYNHEVTAAEYKACVDAGGCTYTGSTTGSRRTYNRTGRENHPINYISWDKAREFISWMNGSSAHTYRLCTEAEWEYAARAGSTTIFPCGNDASCLDNIAWYKPNSDDISHNVRTKSANSWGLYDMIGNAYEWVEDYYHTDYTGAPADGSSWDDTTSDKRVFRGGYWRKDAEKMRSAYRGKIAPNSNKYYIGFRFCR